eukprot:12217706-Alexandrium_andersonii.AAC.1
MRGYMKTPFPTAGSLGGKIEKGPASGSIQIPGGLGFRGSGMSGLCSSGFGLATFGLPEFAGIAEVQLGTAVLLKGALSLGCRGCRVSVAPSGVRPGLGLSSP